MKIFRYSILALLIFYTHAAVQAQLRSPEQFLGYKLGERYTLHHRLVSYYESLAQAAPSQIRLDRYGYTNEGRPLLLLFISSPENLQNLENIRKNNLRLAQVLKDNEAPADNAPAIVWLSYNVHGNETSSSEAAMKTVFELLQPNNPAVKEWLKNTVVVVDPCINPDGRDRYVNWYNTVRATTPNADIYSREHWEPWPGGRTNHYHYDLNRDWAWQTQVETKQRLKVYNQWLPQIHVDFHEQGINEPYYFAPAAEPLHEVITPWQREFQVTIGKNHARYFDANGWLYFTKLRFDLLYPSYGDTYPTYNGAIGMTYEQAGGGIAGAAVVVEDGDTLTLKDRLEHHYTTGISTIEISSQHASRLIREFRKFFSDAVTQGVGEYKTYVIRKRGMSREKEYSITQLLDNIGIQYGYAEGKTPAKGFSYFSGKDEAFTLENGDLVISALQPKSAMLKVLFEPRTKLSDSATYDITAWAMPYAYGLEAFAVREKVNVRNASPDRAATMPVSVPANAYAYVIPWNSFQSAQVLGQLLQQGVKVRYAEQPFSVQGKKYDRGSLIITKAANTRFGGTLSSVIAKAVESVPGYFGGVEAVNTGFVDSGFDLGSDFVRYIRTPRVAIVHGDGVDRNAGGQLWHFFEQELKYPVAVFDKRQLAQMDWKSFDVLVLANGNYDFMTDKEASASLKEWIRNGGRLVTFENATAQVARLDLGLKARKADESDNKDAAANLRKYENRERDYLVNSIPGAIFKVNLDPSHPLAFGYGDFFYTLKQDTRVYDFLTEGWNVGVLKKGNYVSGFAGSRTQSMLQEGLLIGVLESGQGQIVCFADDVIFRSFWENGRLLVANAVFLVGQ